MINSKMDLDGVDEICGEIEDISKLEDIFNVGFTGSWSAPIPNDI